MRSGSIPTRLATIPIRLGYEDKVVEFNLVVAKVTTRYNIPLWDFGGASIMLQTLSNGRDVLVAAGKGGVAIALDRMERGTGELSAVQEVERSYNIPVVSIARLDDLVAYLATDSRAAPHLESIRKYRAQYGVGSHD